MGGSLLPSLSLVILHSLSSPSGNLCHCSCGQPTSDYLGILISSENGCKSCVSELCKDHFIEVCGNAPLVAVRCIDRLSMKPKIVILSFFLVVAILGCLGVLLDYYPDLKNILNIQLDIPPSPTIGPRSAPDRATRPRRRGRPPTVIHMTPLDLPLSHHEATAADAVSSLEHHEAHYLRSSGVPPPSTRQLAECSMSRQCASGGIFRQVDDGDEQSRLRAAEALESFMVRSDGSLLTLGQQNGRVTCGRIGSREGSNRCSSVSSASSSQLLDE